MSKKILLMMTLATLTIGASNKAISNQPIEGYQAKSGGGALSFM